jgi:hypothetical protein
MYLSEGPYEAECRNLQILIGFSGREEIIHETPDEHNLKLSI